MIKPATNYVLIKPDGGRPAFRGFGLAHAVSVDEHQAKPCTGTVVAVCDDLYYGGYDLLRLPKEESGLTRSITERSMMFDVPIEVIAGDRVLFSSIVYASDDTIWHEGLLLIRYDWLICRIDFQVPHPLNGAVLIERFDSYQVVGPLRSEATMMPGWGRVVAEGVKVKSYLLWPERGGDFLLSLQGKMIMFRQKHAVRIEHDAYRALNISSQYPYYYLHRYAINGYVET